MSQTEEKLYNQIINVIYFLDYEIDKSTKDLEIDREVIENLRDSQISYIARKVTDFIWSILKEQAERIKELEQKSQEQKVIVT